jgi:hypothetical protein
LGWHEYLSYFAAGAFLANGVPHFVNGISGRRFQSPFAWPPGVGESPPAVNVIWGLANFAGGFALVFGVGDFRFGLNRAAMMAGLGALAASVFLAVYFERIRRRSRDAAVNREPGRKSTPPEERR